MFLNLQHIKSVVLLLLTAVLCMASLGAAAPGNTLSAEGPALSGSFEDVSEGESGDVFPFQSEGQDESPGEASDMDWEEEDAAIEPSVWALPHQDAFSKKRPRCGLAQRQGIVFGLERPPRI